MLLSKIESAKKLRQFSVFRPEVTADLGKPSGEGTPEWYSSFSSNDGHSAACVILVLTNGNRLRCLIWLRDLLWWNHRYSVLPCITLACFALFCLCPNDVSFIKGLKNFSKALLKAFGENNPSYCRSRAGWLFTISRQFGRVQLTICVLGKSQRYRGCVSCQRRTVWEDG